MSVIAEIQVPTSEFVLASTLEAIPDIRVEFERVVTHGQKWIMPYLWVTSSDLEGVRREIARDLTVAQFEIADRFDGVHLYQIRWSENMLKLVNHVFDRAGVLVEATADSETWDLVVQFDTRQSLSTLEWDFNGRTVPYRLKRLYSPDTPRKGGYNLTAAQRDTLVLAIERGFFDIPRETTLEELGTELDITSTAVSERLRRAIVALGKNTLPVSDS
jgi:predicted DNA binding protein